MPEQVKRAGLYVLLVVLMLGTLLRGGYFPLQKALFAIGLLWAGAIELAVVIASGGSRAWRSFAFLSLAAFSIFAVTTRFWTITPEGTNRETLLLAGYLAALFVVRSQLLRGGERVLTSVSSWFVYTVTFVAAWGLLAFLWRWEPYAGMLDNVFRAGSTFEYSNALSCFSLMGLPVTVALLRTSQPWDRPLLASAACLQAAAVLISYSRFGVVALAALSIYLVLTGRQGRKALPMLFILAASVPLAVTVTVASESNYPLAGLAAAIVILIAAGVVENFSGRPGFRKALNAGTAVAAAVSLTAALALAVRNERMRTILSTRFGEGFSWSRLLPHRLDTWQGTVDAFRVKPATGSGLGSFATVFTGHAIAVYTKYAHNLILQMAVDTGIAGAVLLGVFLAYVIGLSLLRIFTRAQPLARGFALAGLIFVAYNMFDWEWYVPALTAWFLVGVACLEKITPEGNANEKT